MIHRVAWKFRIVPWLGLALVAASPVAGVSPVPDDLLRAADAARHPIEEGVLTIRATVTGRTPEPPAVSDIEVYVRGGADALTVFRTGPLAGRRILDAGGKTWLIVPGSKRPIPIGAGRRLMGGAAIGTLARLRFADDFDAAARPGGESIDGVRCLVLDLTARRAQAPYAGGALWIGAADSLPRRARFTLPSGKPAEEVRFTFRAARGASQRLEGMEIDHLLAPDAGTHTRLDLVAATPRPLDAGLFTPAGAGGLR
jgi:hypothetical protein